MSLAETARRNRIDALQSLTINVHRNGPAVDTGPAALSTDRDVKRSVCRFLCSMQTVLDISDMQHKSRTQRIAREAPLTDLPTRQALKQLFSQELMLRQRELDRDFRRAAS